jgi:hypothetical protein
MTPEAATCGGFFIVQKGNKKGKRKEKFFKSSVSQ